MKNFQLVTLAVFGIFAVFGVLVFSGTIKIGSDSANTAKGTVVLWGTYKSSEVSKLFDNFNAINQTYDVKYIQKNPNTFSEDLLEAIASGNAPDMFFMPDDLIAPYANKIYTIPYSSYPLANYKSVFAQSGEVFLTQKGILAFPIVIDPLVMYYNRNILDSNGVAFPPDNWETFTSVATKITQKSTDGQILRSAAPFGQYANVSSAKEILAMLFMQIGNSIIKENNNIYNSVLNQKVENLPEPASVLSFYTSFADPAKANYMWNKSFPNSKDYFAGDNSAFYFGHASEAPSLIAKNPNLNFALVPVPQIKGTNFKATSAHAVGIAITSFSKNLNTAITAATSMSQGDFAKQFAETLGLAPARRDLLAKPPADIFSPYVYSSALMARSWIDPSKKDTDNIFRSMLEQAFSSTNTKAEVIDEASSRLQLLLFK